MVMISSPIGARREAVIVRLQGPSDRQPSRKSKFGTSPVEVRTEIPLCLRSNPGPSAASKSRAASSNPQHRTWLGRVLSPEMAVKKGFRFRHSTLSDLIFSFTNPTYLAEFICKWLSISATLNDCPGDTPRNHKLTP
jgi:hypothetical protein